MKHWRYILLIFAILIFTGGPYLYVSASSFLSHYLTLTLGTRTTTQSLSFHPPFINLHNLKVRNPPGYTLPFALIINKLSTKTSYLNYLRNPTPIDEIVLDGVHLDIEFTNNDRTKGNWITLMDHININHISFIPRYSIIKTLNINNLEISIYLNDEDGRRLPMIKNLSFSNIKTEKGRFIEELTEIIVKKMMNEVFLKEDVQSVIGLPFSIFGMTNKEEPHGFTY